MRRKRRRRRRTRGREDEGVTRPNIIILQDALVYMHVSTLLTQVYIYLIVPVLRECCWKCVFAGSLQPTDAQDNSNTVCRP